MAIAPARFFSYGNVFAGSAALTPSEKSLFKFIAHVVPRLDLRNALLSTKATSKIAVAYNSAFGTALDLADAVGRRDLICGLCSGDLGRVETLWEVPAGPQGPELRHTGCGFDTWALETYINALMVRVVQDRVRARHPGFGPTEAELADIRTLSEVADTYTPVRYTGYHCDFWNLRCSWPPVAKGGADDGVAVN